MIAIGVDPGKKTGLAIWCLITRRFVEISTTDFWGAIDKIESYAKIHTVKVFIEKPNTKAVWHKGGKTTAVNVGSVLREAGLLIEFCKRKGFEYKAVPPMGKLDKDPFKKITKWNSRTSEHSRDAAMLVFGLK